jgi:hypothetical protein
MRETLKERLGISSAAEKLIEQALETAGQFPGAVETTGAMVARMHNVAQNVDDWRPYLSKGSVADREVLLDLVEKQKFLVSLVIAEYENTREAKKKLLNENDLLANNIASMSKKVGQRAAVVKSMSGDTTAVVRQSFLSAEEIDSENTTNEMKIFLSQGVATLPVTREEVLRVRNLGISNGSNGLNGNSDAEITTSLGYLSSILDGDPDNWFEYERIGDGPLRLNLDVILEEEQVLNYIKMGFVLPGDSRSFVIKDIVFNDKDGGVVSIKDISVRQNDESFWNAVRNDGVSDWDIVFLPVEVKRFTVKLVQRDSYLAPLRGELRRRFAIGIKSIEVKRLSFASEGTLKSTEIPLRRPTYRMESRINAFPASLFSYRLTTKVGDIKVSQTSDREAIPLNGDERSLEYILKVEREDARLERASSVLPAEEAYELSSLSRPVATAQSPAVVPLRENLEDSKIFLMQSRVMRLGDEGFKTIVATQETRIFDLPFSLTDKNITPTNLVVKIESNTYEYVAEESLLSGETWTLNNKGDKVIVSSDWDGWGLVEIYALPELLNFELTSKGYEARFNYLFDPDKHTIDVLLSTGLNTTYSKNLSKNRKTEFLGHRNINLSTFKVFSALYGERNRVEYIGDLNDPDEYYVNAASGMITLFAETGTDTWTAQFQASPQKLLNKKGYEILFDDEKPVGIIISPEEVSAFSIREVVDEDLLYRNDPLTGDWTQTTISGGGGRKLSYEHIIKGTLSVSDGIISGEENPTEISYIDGVKEFYGAIQVTERTNQISPTAGQVQFALAAGANTITADGFGFRFSVDNRFLVRKALVGSLATEGDYHISGAGVVTLKTTTTLPANIEITYYYKDPEFVPDNKYSVDYVDGVLHSRSALNDNGRITYKVCPAVAKYFIAKEIEDFTYEAKRNTIEFPTEQLSLKEDRSIVKVFWRKKKGTGNAARMKEYFSPIFEAINYRFY